MATQMEELNEKDQVKYSVTMEKKDLTIKYRRYPLLHKGYGNYEELNVILKKRKNINVEVFLIRQSWNSTGTYPVCRTKIPMDDGLFNISDNVKESVMNVLYQLKSKLENTECESGVLLYFP